MLNTEPTVFLNNAVPKTMKLTFPEPLLINCSAKSDPSTEVTVTWMINEHFLAEEPDRFLISTDGVLTLITKNEGENAEAFVGSYKCTASNGVSKISRYINVTLTEEPLGELVYIITVLSTRVSMLF